jgi:Mn-containing catalase
MSEWFNLIKNNCGIHVAKCKIIHFTPDPLVKETLRFLMTREVAHFQMFEAALESIPNNFPPGILQSDPRYSNTYFNLSNGEDVRGPWNDGKSSRFQEEWRYISEPKQHINDTLGLIDETIEETDRSEKSVQKTNLQMSQMRKSEIDESNKPVGGKYQWSKYRNARENTKKSPVRKKIKK